MRPILITGASGMIGANLVRRLLADGGWIIHLMTRADSPGPRLAGLADQLVVHRADLTESDSTRRAVQEAAPEAVIHLASTAFNPPPAAEQHVRTNVLGMFSLMDALAGARGTKVLFAGSAAQYGGGNGLRENGPERPATLLGASKTAAAALLHAYGRMEGLATLEFRLFTPYGPWERPGRIIPHTILSALAGKDVEMTSGTQERDFLQVDDAVEGLVRGLGADLPAGTVLNLCSGQPVTIAALVARLLSLMGDPVAMRSGAVATRADEIHCLSGDWSLANQLLGWSPSIDLDEGLERSIKWVADNRDLIATLS